MADSDPIDSFFPSAPPDILYTVLELSPAASSDEIKKAYRKSALRYHPDKHAAKPDTEKEALKDKFQQVGFAWAVLGDEKKRKRYDATGRTNDAAFEDAEAMGWEAYFDDLYQRIDSKMLDEDKKKYQGSQQEIDDVIKAYNSTSGSFPGILDHIPHSQCLDEVRFISIISSLITDGTLLSTPLWERSSTDKKAQAKRSKAALKSSREAEEAAKELGVWDEFYGDGVKGKRQSGEKATDRDDDVALGALIQKRQRDREGGLDALEAKYRKLEEQSQSKRKAKGAVKGMPDISDAEFEALRAKTTAKRDPPTTKKRSKGKA